MRVLALAILTTMMVSAKLAGAQTPDPDFRLPFRGTSNSAFQWNYSCPQAKVAHLIVQDLEAQPALQR